LLQVINNLNRKRIISQTRKAFLEKPQTEKTNTSYGNNPAKSLGKNSQPACTYCG